MPEAEQYPRGPWGMARQCEATIIRLEAERAALPKAGRSSINARLHEVRKLLAWCKTRAGYSEPEMRG